MGDLWSLHRWGGGGATTTWSVSDRPPHPAPTGEGFPSARRRQRGQEGPTASASREDGREDSRAGSPSPSSDSEGGITYAEVLAGRKRPEKRRKERMSARNVSRITFRVPGVGVFGLSGIGTGDLEITAPGPGPGPREKIREEEPLVRRESSPSPCSRMHGKGENERKRGHLMEEMEVFSMRCFRCLEVGHPARLCGGPDRSRRCYRCSADSCKWRKCGSGVSKCPLCADLETPDSHILGSGVSCRKLTPERKKRGRHKGGEREERASWSPPGRGDQRVRKTSPSPSGESEGT